MFHYLSRIKPLELHSQLLRGNPLGNPCHRMVMVLEPAKDTMPEAVVYMLDGYLGTGRGMLADTGALGASFPAALHGYQNEGLFPPCLFVFVDGSTLLGGSQYMNSSANGPFADHIVREIVPAVENHYQASGCPRIVAGHSSGGFGALWLATEFPGFFHACLASAADSAFELSLQPLFLNAALRLARSGSPGAFLAELKNRPNPERCPAVDFQTLLVLAMASCYSPQVGFNEIHSILPFDLHTLEVNQEIWSRWLGFDPARFDNARLKNLGALQLLMLDCGSDDEYGAQFGHRRLSARLKTLGIAHVHEEFPGGHNGTKHRYRERLTRLAATLRARSPV